MRPSWLAAAALLAFLPSLAGVFQFDDYNVIVNDPTVHAWSTLFERLGGGLRPLLKASYTLSWTLGLDVLGFHLLNIAVHALNTLLVYALGRSLCTLWFGRARAGRCDAAVAFAALLFALHPVQVEAVTYVSGRSSSLMASFYLGALLAYLGGRRALSAVLFVLAAATKEAALTLPAALLLIELSAPERADWRTLARRQAAHWLLLAAGVVVLFAHPRYFELLSFGFTRRDLAENLLTQIGGVAYLVSRLLGLQGANIDPALPTLSAWSATLVLQALLFALLLLLGISQLRRRPWIGFGVLWFFLQLAPTNSFVPRLDVANDRQLYLAGWGLFFALSVQIARLAPPGRLVAVAAPALLALLAGASVLRQLDYRSEVILWEADARKAPWNARAYNNLGYAYQQAGDHAAARRAYRTALYFDPHHRKARFNLESL